MSFQTIRTIHLCKTNRRKKKNLAKLGLLWDVKLYVVNHLYLLEGSFRKKFKNFSIKNLFKKIQKKIWINSKF